MVELSGKPSKGSKQENGNYKSKGESGYNDNW